MHYSMWTIILYIQVESNQKIDIKLSNNHMTRYHAHVIQHFLLEKQKIFTGNHLCMIQLGQIREKFNIILVKSNQKININTGIIAECPFFQMQDISIISLNQRMIWLQML